MSVFRFVKKPNFTQAMGAAYDMQLLKLWKTGAAKVDKDLNLLKMARNTWSNTRKNLFKERSDFNKLRVFKDHKVNPLISTDEFRQKAVEKIGETQGNILYRNLLKSKTDFQQILNNRRKLGKLAGIHAHGLNRHVNKFSKEGTQIDRVVNARAKGIAFRRIGGRIVPIRTKK